MSATGAPPIRTSMAEAAKAVRVSGWNRGWRSLGAAIALLTVPAPSPLWAQSGSSLAGKNVQMIIGFGAGSFFDIWGRLVARHLGRHLPGQPTVVPQTMPGAGSLVAANYIYNIAPRDGTALAIIASNVALGPITGAAGARFDPLRFTWVGTAATQTQVCVAANSPQVKVRTLADLFENELVVGATGPGANSYTTPKALSGLLGMRFKVVTGFPSAVDVLLAIERGEIDGICQTIDGIATLRPDWIANRKVAVLFQGGAAPNPALAGVPFVGDLARNADERTAIEFLYAGEGLSRPFIAPPDLGTERAGMLQDAFMATMRDAEFRADAQRQGLDVAPRDGAYLAALIARIYATPKSIVERIAELTR
jgi:tripartite-type tricarboxylate transporter receptor subunit TctC